MVFGFSLGEDIEKSLENRVGLAPNMRLSAVQRESVEFLKEEGGVASESASVGGGGMVKSVSALVDSRTLRLSENGDPS